MNDNEKNVSYIAMIGEINSTTAQNLITTISDVPKNINTIYLLLSTTGGSVSDGFVIYNYLRSLPYKLIIHNVGNVDSIGNVIFLAADERFATDNALFLFHRVKIDPKLELMDLSLAQEKLDGIEKDEERIGEVFKSHTRMNDEDLREFFDTGSFRTARIALEQGIIHEIMDFPQVAKITVVEVRASKEDKKRKNEDNGK